MVVLVCGREVFWREQEWFLPWDGRYAVKPETADEEDFVLPDWMSQGEEGQVLVESKELVEDSSLPDLEPATYVSFELRLPVLAVGGLEEVGSNESVKGL